MKLSTHEFTRALERATLCVPRRATTPVLGCVRLDTAEDRVRLHATTLDCWLTTEVPARINGWSPDACLMGPRELMRGIKIAGGEEISAGPGEDGQIAFSAGGTTLAVGTFPSDDWSPAPILTGDSMWSATLGSDAMAVMARCARAVSTEETRYYLNGLHLCADGTWSCSAVATDGHRLFMGEIKTPDGAGVLPGVIIPRDALRQIIALHAMDKGAPVRLRIAPNIERNQSGDLAPSSKGMPWVEVVIGSTRLVARPIDGKFPDYQRVIPSDTPIMAIFDRLALREAVTAISCGSARGRNQPSIKVEIGKGAAVLSCAWMAINGSGHAEVACEGNAAGATFGLNGRYLADLVDAIMGERVTFAMEAVKTAGMNPIVVAGVEDESFRAVQMPMRV